MSDFLNLKHNDAIFLISGVHKLLSKASKKEALDLDDMTPLERSPRSRLYNERFLFLLFKNRKGTHYLDPEDATFFKQIYLNHHDNKATWIYFEHLKNSKCDQRTLELVLDLALQIEEMTYHSGNRQEAFECLMKQIEDLDLRLWVFDNMDRGFVYKIKLPIMECLKQCPRVVGHHLATALSFMTGFAIVACFYFDLWKDVIAFLVLNHISDKILVNFFYITSAGARIISPFDFSTTNLTLLEASIWT